MSVSHDRRNSSPSVARSPGDDAADDDAEAAGRMADAFFRMATPAGGGGAYLAVPLTRGRGGEAEECECR